MQNRLQFVVLIAILIVGVVNLWVLLARVSESLPLDPMTAQPGPFTGGCFEVKRATSPPPHAELGDEFCVNQTAAGWVLTPGAGMSDWTPVGGAAQIVLTETENSPGSHWQGEFDVNIVGHAAGTHGPGHLRPDFGYRLRVILGPNRAMILPSDQQGGTVHGGTAHADTD